MLLALWAGVACSRKSEWHDPSKHEVQFVTVQAGVRLEVLDWGGSGRPLVLLAGNGLSAHIYDGFAEKLAGSYHVYGITRRGMGASTHAESGYDENRLADDVLRVIDSLLLTKPVLLGHSKAGGEMTVLASQHPDRLGGLVYMDAARDIYDDSALLKRAVQAGWRRPEPSPADVKSFADYHDWQKRTLGYAFPESELRSVFSTNPDGSMGPYKSARSIFDQLFAGTHKSKDYSKIRVPVLTFFNVPVRAEDIVPRGFQFKDARSRAMIEENRAVMVQYIKNDEKKLQACPCRVRIVELPSSDHYVFIVSEGEVLREIRAFLESLP